MVFYLWSHPEAVNDDHDAEEADSLTGSLSAPVCSPSFIL